MRKSFIGLGLMLAAAFPCQAISSETVSGTIPPEELAEKWAFLGAGTRAAQNRMFFMEESPGSAGVTVISPEVYTGDITVRYEVMPLNPTSICVALLAVSNQGEGNSLTLPASVENSPALSALDAYFFAFHNLGHNRKPFLLKFPDGNNLKEVEDNVMRSGQFHAVEVRRRGRELSLKIDGETVFIVEDENPLPGGHIGLRLRGIPQIPAACLIRNLRIEGTVE